MDVVAQHSAVTSINNTNAPNNRQSSLQNATIQTTQHKKNYCLDIFITILGYH